MASSLKQYVVVGFISESAAKDALDATLAQFRKWNTPLGDLSRTEGNMVYLHVSNHRERTLIENFLLSQHGAQPKGCRCKV